MAGKSQRELKPPINSSTCTSCRLRRVRCNREKPCSACVNRGVAQDCDVPDPINLVQVGSGVRGSASQGYLAPEIDRIRAITDTLKSSHAPQTRENVTSAYTRHQNSRSSDPYLAHRAPSSSSPEVRSYNSHAVNNFTQQTRDLYRPWPVSNNRLRALPQETPGSMVGWLQQTYEQNSQFPSNRAVSGMSSSPVNSRPALTPLTMTPSASANAERGIRSTEGANQIFGHNFMLY